MTVKAGDIDEVKTYREKSGKKRGRLPKKLKEEMRQKLLAAKEALIANREALKADNAFWFFEPNVGVIGHAGKEYLRKHLREEDIPERIDGQDDVFRSTASILGVSGANQSGKSVTGAMFAYILATGEIPHYLRGIFPESELIKKKNGEVVAGRIVGVDNKTTLNTLIPTYQKWCPKEYLKNGRWMDSFSAEQRKLFLYRDGVVVATLEFMTNQMDVESFQGPPIDFIIYDEEPREEIRRENLMRFVTAGKLKEVFCWTPTKGMTWTYDLFVEGIKGKKVELYKICSVANKKANIEVLDEIMGQIDSYEEKKMRLLGEFISLSGLVYGRLFDQRTHVISPFYEGMNDYNKRKYLTLVGLDPHLVTPTAMVFVLLDREGNLYVDRCYARDVDTEELKVDFWRIVKEQNYRIGWTVADKSADSSIMAFGGRNIFREISRGKNAIPAMRTSEKYEGSIKAGVDEIKKRLRYEEGKKPTFFIVDRPENRDLIKSFKTLERDTYADEEKNGPKDRIKEGKHHHHSALRFITQFPCNWYEDNMKAPEPEFQDEAVLW